MFIVDAIGMIHKKMGHVKSKLSYDGYCLEKHRRFLYRPKYEKSPM